jgi:hypothetical protein
MSELRADTITGSDGTSPVTLTKQHAAKAWLKYAGSGTTFDDSEGVSSATDNGTGDYTYSLTLTTQFVQQRQIHLLVVLLLVRVLRMTSKQLLPLM